jgi:hypothetical protein
MGEGGFLGKRMLDQIIFCFSIPFVLLPLLIGRLGGHGLVVIIIILLLLFFLLKSKTCQILFYW